MLWIGLGVVVIGLIIGIGTLFARNRTSSTTSIRSAGGTAGSPRTDRDSDRERPA